MAVIATRFLISNPPIRIGLNSLGNIFFTSSIVNEDQERPYIWPRSKPDAPIPHLLRPNWSISGQKVAYSRTRAIAAINTVAPFTIMTGAISIMGNSASALMM